MGYQIIRQPNGLYALWSSIVDAFILFEATPENIIQNWNVSDERHNRERVVEVVGKLKRGEKPYHQFTMTWNEAVRWMRKTGSAPEQVKRIDEELFLPKKEAKERLKCSSENRGYNLWLHLPSGRAIPDKPENANDSDWRRITAWLNKENQDD